MNGHLVQHYRCPCCSCEHKPWMDRPNLMHANKVLVANAADIEEVALARKCSELF